MTETVTPEKSIKQHDFAESTTPEHSIEQCNTTETAYTPEHCAHQSNVAETPAPTVSSVLPQHKFFRQLDDLKHVIPLKRPLRAPRFTTPPAGVMKRMLRSYRSDSDKKINRRFGSRNDIRRCKSDHLASRIRRLKNVKHGTRIHAFLREGGAFTNFQYLPARLTRKHLTQ